MLLEEKKERGQRHREVMARRSREHSQAVSDIGEIPPVVDQDRRESCRFDLHRFLTVYFPNSTGLSPFSLDHDRVIKRIELCILQGGRFVNAVYRGFAKTTISENAAIWASIYGHRKFIPIFGSDAATATGNIESIKMELSDNDLLYEDFPEVCHPVRALDGRPQRRLSQSYQGVLTHIEWSAEQVVLPTIPGSLASGAVICARGITSGFRGMKVKRPDGTQQRPDFIILDDPQTDESSSSALGVSKTISTLRKAIVKLGGHRRQLAIVINATVIHPDDAVDKLLADPSWQGERIPMVRKWPDVHKTLWLESYAGIRSSYDKDKVDDQKRAWQEATAFYRARRGEMDAGAILSWDGCFDPETELSALQHAYNALIDDGEESFASEYQNQPLPRIRVGQDDLSADQIAAKLNRSPRGMVPSVGVDHLTSFIDVQQRALYWMVIGWGTDFSGFILDYGAWPDQRRAYFTLGDIRRTIQTETGIDGLEPGIYAALEQLTAELLGKAWMGGGGTVSRVEKCLVDANWGQSTQVVYQFCRQSPHAAVLTPSHGKYVGASSRPFAEWTKHPGDRVGLNWRVPAGGRRDIKHVLFDANWWKSFVYSRLSVPMGGKGCLSLFGDKPDLHRMLADHLTSEYRIRTEGRGRSVDEWKLRPERPDNHLFDAMVGNAVAASMLGCTLGDIQEGGKKAKGTGKRRSFSEMQREARGY